MTYAFYIAAVADLNNLHLNLHQHRYGVYKPLNPVCHGEISILFYSILFYSIPFHSTLFYSIRR